MLLDRCPKCGAQDEAAAEDDGLCCHTSACPMLCAYEWSDALALLNKQLEAAQIGGQQQGDVVGSTPGEQQPEEIPVESLPEDTEEKIPHPSGSLEYRQAYYRAHKEKLRQRYMEKQEAKKQLLQKAQNGTPEEREAALRSLTPRGQRGRPATANIETIWQVLQLEYTLFEGAPRFAQVRGETAASARLVREFPTEDEAVAWTPTKDFLAVRSVKIRRDPDTQKVLARNYKICWYSREGLWRPYW